MKVLYFTDIHIKHNAFGSIDELKAILDDMFVKKQMFDCAVIAGDVLHTHERVDVQLMNSALDIIACTRKLVDGKVYVIVGNHDYINNTQFLSTNHWMNALKEWSDIVVVDQPKWIVDGRMLCVPYVYPGRFNEALLEKDTTGTIFCHQEFRGCKLGNIISKDGDEHPTTDVISGHIHERHHVGSKIYYPGNSSVYVFDFDDVTYKLTGERAIEYRIHKPPNVQISSTSFLDPAFVPDSSFKYRINEVASHEVSSVLKKCTGNKCEAKINLAKPTIVETNCDFDHILKQLMSSTDEVVRHDFEQNVERVQV